MEMHLCARTAQTVAIPNAAIDIEFAAGETIWTESSHKFTVERLHELATAADFKPETCWTDPEWPFAEYLLTVSGES